MRTLPQIARKFRQTDGAEIAEAALVLPLVFMLLLGIVWFGRAFNIYSTIQQAAQQGAITAARSSCATCGNAASVDGTVAGPSGTVAGTIGAVMQASSIDPTQIPVNSNAPSPPPCANPPGACLTTGDNITICRNVQLNPSAGNTQTPVCGAVVGFQYPFQFYLPFTSLNLQQITLTAQAQSRMEN